VHPNGAIFDVDDGEAGERVATSAAVAAPPWDTAAQSASTAPSATSVTHASSPSRLRRSTATLPDSSTSLRLAASYSSVPVQDKNERPRE
jgi:hypothetical protein